MRQRLTIHSSASTSYILHHGGDDHVINDFGDTCYEFCPGKSQFRLVKEEMNMKRKRSIMEAAFDPNASTGLTA